MNATNAALHEIGDRISGLRDACGYTREEMASALNLDTEIYVAYEENGLDIPISIIFEIANKFNVDFTEIITGTAGKLTTYHVVRAGKGRVIDRYDGYFYNDLAYRYSHKIMQPLMVTLLPTEEPAEELVHSGQEFNYVVKGTVVLRFDGKDILLNEGDSIYFNSAHPHSQRCGNNESAVFLTVIAE